MLKRWLPYAFFAAAIAIGLYAFFLRSSDEDLIRERLGQLAAAVRIDDGELNPIVRHGRVREGFREVFTKDALARIPEIRGSLNGRDELVMAATQLAAVYSSASVGFGDVDVRVDPARTAARVTATATVSGTRNGQPNRRDERKVVMDLEKIDGEWKIVLVTASPPGGDDEAED